MQKRKREDEVTADYRRSLSRTKPSATPSAEGMEILDNASAIYRPLDPGWIRVLILYPGVLGEPLTASLEHIELSRLPGPPTAYDSEAVYGEDVEESDGEEGDEKFDGSEVEDSEVEDSEADDSEVENSEADDSEIDNSEGDDGEIDNSEGDDGEIDDSEVDDSKIDGSKIDGSEVHDSEVHDSGLDDSEIHHSEEDDNEGDNDESYEAISYVWGPPVFDHEIYIQPGGTLKITESLYWALQHLRHENRARRLWADAVCINQNNGKEKGEQVGRMFKIFQRASQVLVWLGCEELGDDIAFATIDAFSDQDFDGIDIFDESELRNFSEMLRQKLQELEPEPVELVDGLLATSRLFTRPWWTRLWVLQEQASHQDEDSIIVVSGRLQTSWRLFVRAVITCEVSLDHGLLRWPSDWTCTELDYRNASSTLTEIFQMNSSIASMRWTMKLLVDCSSHQCVDARDRIYAVYDWQELSGKLGFKPDYGIRVQDLYQSFAETLCLSAPEYITTAMLSLAGTEAAEAVCDVRPSWVPHFHHLTRRSRRKYAASQGYGSSPQGQFGCRSPVDDSHSSEAVVELGYLKLRGRCFGTVTNVMLDTGWPERAAHSEMLRCVTSWYHTCKNHLENWFPGSHGTVLSSKSRLQDDLLSLFPAGWMYGLRRRVMTNQEDVGDDTHSQSAPSFDDGLISELCDIVQDKHWDWNDTVVPNNVDLERYLGLVTINEGSTDLSWLPKSAQVGDRLCAFRGGRFPFLLRESREGRFRLLGDAWTFRTTLQEALGGNHECEYPADCRDFEWDDEANRLKWADCNKWDSEDEEMQRLIANLEYITLE